MWYKPATKVDAAECGLSRRYVANSENLVEYDFRPPTTDLVRVFMDMHEENTDIHITPEERTKWNAGSVTYTLSKTGSTIKLAGSDGTEQTVTDDNTTYGTATTSAAGLMSAADKAKVDGIATNIKNGSNPGSLQTILGCTASSAGAVAFGQSSSASGAFSFASGSFTSATGDDCFSTGVYTSSSGRAQAVVGKHNQLYDGPTGTNDTTGTQFIVGVGTGTSARANAFRVTTDGYCRGQNAFSGSGADYAEYFEWLDGNANGEDRRGYFVTLEGNKIRKATAADEYILGVISATPAMIGNTYSDMWQGMYMTDIFGKRLTETVEVAAATDPDTGEVIPAHTETRFILNPEYDPEQPYAGRNERAEWDTVGIVGQLVVIDDGTCEVNGYCKVADGGTATKSEEKTAYRIIERLDATHIRIFIK